MHNDTQIQLLIDLQQNGKENSAMKDTPPFENHQSKQGVIRRANNLYSAIFNSLNFQAGYTAHWHRRVLTSLHANNELRHRPA